MKVIFIVWVSFFTTSLNYGSVNYPSKEEKQLVGVWNASSSMAAGWSDTYVFFPNHKWIMRLNQSDCSKRVISEEGTWQVKNKKLILTIQSKKEIKGGKLVAATGSCATEYEIEDGQIIDTVLKPVITKELSLSKITFDQVSNKKTVKINKIQFWKFYDEPKDSF